MHAWKRKCRHDRLKWAPANSQLFLLASLSVHELVRTSAHFLHLFAYLHAICSWAAPHGFVCSSITIRCYRMMLYVSDLQGRMLARLYMQYEHAAPTYCTDIQFPTHPCLVDQAT